MTNKILILCLGIFLISLASAEIINITSGESISFDIGEHYKYYLIDGNSTEVDLNITQNETFVIILINKYMNSDLFSITFFNKEDEVIKVYSSGGGGSGCRYNPNFDWNCSEWSTCVNETQMRICKTRNNCGNYYGKPNETQSCIAPIILQKDNDTNTDVDEPEPEKQIKWSWIIIMLIGFIFLINFLIKGYFKKRREKIIQDKS